MSLDCNARSLQGNFARSAANQNARTVVPYNEVVYVGFVDQEKRLTGSLKSKDFVFFERIMGLGNLGFLITKSMVFQGC